MATKTQNEMRSNFKSAKKSLESAGTAVMNSEPVRDVIHWARDYARENPESAALWCFGIGFVLAWKLKPW